MFLYFFQLKSQISQLETTNRELLFRIDSMAESEEQVHVRYSKQECYKFHFTIIICNLCFDNFC